MATFLICVMAALLGALGYIFKLWEEIQNLEGRVLSQKDSLVRFRSKEQSTQAQLIETGRKLKETKDLLAKAKRAAIIPTHAQDHLEIRTELEPVEVKAKAIHYAEEDNKAPERFIKELLLRELNPYISIDRRLTEIEAKITVLKVK